MGEALKALPMTEKLCQLQAKEGLRCVSVCERCRLAELHAYAEREKYLVETLKEIALLSNNNRTNKKMLGDKARAILSKHKEQK